MSGVSVVPFLGVIGGMGPAATADFLAKLVVVQKARRDQDNVPVLVWGDCCIPDRTTALSTDPDSVGEKLAAAAKSLSDLGAVALVMPCNTAHSWSAEIEASSPLPLLHIVDATMDWLARQNIRKAGFLATEGTISSGLYQSRFKQERIELIEPTELQQASTNQAIALVKAGKLDLARSALLPVLFSMRGRGAERTVLACTELPLALSAENDVIDTTLCLAKYASTWWTARYANCGFRGETCVE